MEIKKNLSADGVQKSFYGKAQYIVCADNSVVLLSYGTPVAAVEYDGTFRRLWCGWSATTARHIRAFGRAFGAWTHNKAWWDALPVGELTSIQRHAMTATA